MLELFSILIDDAVGVLGEIVAVIIGVLSQEWIGGAIVCACIY